MGINRFSTTGTSEYTPQHVPLPFDTITKMGEQVKLEHDTADAEAAKWKTDIQGGLATQEHAKALNAKKNAMLAEAQTRAEQTGNYGRLTQDVKEIASAVQNDPLYQGIQRDIAITKDVNKQRTDPNHPYVIQNYSDEKGNVKQLGVDQPFDESYYNVVAPGDRNAERKPLYAQIKPVISRIYEQPVTKTWIDEMGKEHTQTLQEGVEAEGLRRAQVKNVMANYIKQDPNALNTQSYMYDKARFAKQGLDWTPEQELDATANAFLGEYYNEKEIQKLGADKVTALPKDASGRTRTGGTGDDEDGVVNQYALLVDAKTAQVAAPQLDHLGWAKGPDDVPGSHMVTLDNTDGQGAIVNFAKVTPDNPQANNVVTYGNELNNLKKTTGIENNETFLEKLKAKDPKSTYQIVGNQIYVTSPTIVNGKNTIKTVNVPVETMKESYLKTTDNFKLLAEEAKENGVDISDPKFKDNYLKTLNVKTVKEAEDMGQMFKISGDYPFILKDGNNKTNVGDKAFLDGYIIMTKDQINSELVKNGKYGNEEDWTGSPWVDEWQELFLESSGGNGMIQPYTATRDGIEQFKIPIKKPIQVSQIVNQNYNSSFYTPTVASKKSEYFAESYNDLLGKGMMERRNKVFGQSYTSNPTTFKNNIVADISSDRNIDADIKGELFNMINELKSNPKATKETWVGFKNALDLDGPEEILKKYKNNGVVAQPPATVGKSQGGWSQTPATPLKK
jgi:hypothetical protein